jgi:glycosyltransferase involved in cell wall biosynthesis
MIVSHARAVVTVSERSGGILTDKYPRLDRAKFCTICNGFDRDDIPQRRLRASDDGYMRICHVGSLYGARGPAQVLAGVEALLAQEPSLRRELRVRFVGNLDEHESQVRASACGNVVEAVGPVDHRMATQEMVDADVLLLVIGAGGQAGLPGKIFEYMASGRPILATVPKGSEAGAMLDQAGGAVVVDHADVPGIAQAIRDLHRQWREGCLPLRRNDAYVAQFERRQLARRLAEVLSACRPKK